MIVWYHSSTKNMANPKK